MQSFVQNYKKPIDCADLALLGLIEFASSQGLPVNLRYRSKGHWASYDAGSDDFTSKEQYIVTVLGNLGALNVIDNTHPIKPTELAPGDLLMGKHDAHMGHT